jgi:hypothetical protein
MPKLIIFTKKNITTSRKAASESHSTVDFIIRKTNQSPNKIFIVLKFIVLVGLQIQFLANLAVIPKLW